MAKDIAVKAVFTETESRMLSAITRKWGKERAASGGRAYRAEVLVSGMHRVFEASFPEMQERRMKVIAGVRANHQKRFGEPNTPEKLKALSDDALAACQLELELFLDELEAADTDPGATD